MVDKKIEGKELLIEWHVPENLKSNYATNMVVQYTGEEFVISFFEVKPPIILGSPEEIKSALPKLESVRAECLAQIIVSPKRMKKFIKAMQTHLDQVLSNIENKKEETNDPISG
jgi:hypothetical protein